LIISRRLIAILLLVIAVISIAIIHSFAPDHYLPISTIGKVRNWSLRKTLLIAFITSLIHVTTSIFIGASTIIGIDLLGYAEQIENISPMLLIIFGFGYAVVSFMRPHRHLHTTSLTTLMLILGLSPCIPLIPIMIATDSIAEMITVVVIFSTATVGTIILLTYLSYKAFKPPKFDREDVVSGVIIAIVGVITYIFSLKFSLKKIKKIYKKSEKIMI